MPKIKKKENENLGMSMELPYQCTKEPSLKFYTTLACDIKRDGGQKKANNSFSRRCENCTGPVLIKK
jgi:hypothetical protein